MTTIGLQEAALFLKMHHETLRLKTKSGIIQGAKLGKRWVFILEDLETYIRSQYANYEQTVRVINNEEKNICHSTAEVISGGFVSQRPTEKEYDKALELLTA